MALSTVSGGSLETATDAPATSTTVHIRTSRRLAVTGIISLVTWMLVLIAFASPYWLSSYKYTYSSFVRLGLWDFCFNNYRHPPYQYDEKFNGCHWVFSAKYQNIRDWLQPGWFIFVELFMVLALISSIGSLILLALVLMYYFVRYQAVTLTVAFACQVSTTINTLLAVLIFGIYAFERSWLLYPPFNHLDWAYYVAMASVFASTLACVLLFAEVKAARERRKKLDNLVYNMQPRSNMYTPTNGASAYGSRTEFIRQEQRPMLPPPREQTISAISHPQREPHSTTV